MNAKTRIFIAVLLVVIIGIAAWFFHGVLFRGKIRNVLLISIDTCRDDYLSCYGYPRKTTPNIDAIAKESILFENVITPVPLTLPAHSSMLTGTIPPYHGVHDNLDYQLAESNVTLSEILKGYGFTTGAIISAFVLDRKFGLNQGFDTYDDRFDEELNTVGIVERRGEEASRHANLWLQKHCRDSFFLFLHYFDPHLVYDPPEPFASKFWDNPYAGEVAYTDHCIGQVIEKLKELHLYDSTLIIITGDHGEGLFEHNELSHGFFIYQTTLKVPLIFKVPGGPKGIRIADTVGLIDIVPTVCAMLKIPVPSQIQGRDLSRYFSRRAQSLRESIPYYCESLVSTKYNCNPLLGLVANHWKYIQTTRPELYDLTEDTHELHNLVNEQHQRARILQDSLKQILEEQVRTEVSDESKLALDSESRARLQSLGYVAGGTIDESFEFDRSKEDPKDLIEFHKLNSIASCRVSLGKYSEAKEICEKMLEARPSFPKTYHFLGTISLAEGDYEKAVYYYSKYLEFDPNDYETYTTLGLVFSNLGKFDDAIRNFARALHINPDFREAHYNIGVAYANQRKLDDAIKHWNEALRLGDDDPNTHVNLADALVYLGEADQAITHWEESLKLEPDNAKVHADLANALLRKGKVDQAISHWKETIRLDPNQPAIENNLAEALYVKGRLDEAIRHWQQVLRLYPDWPRVLNNLAWIMATHIDERFRNPAEAVRLAEKACRLTEFKNIESLDTLSAAYAAVGKFDEAIETAEKAEKMCLSVKLQKRAEDIRSRLDLYRAGQPYREQP